MPRRDPAEIAARAGAMLGNFGPRPPAPGTEPLTREEVAEAYAPSRAPAPAGYVPPNHCLALLMQWRKAARDGEDGLTDEEAANRAGLNRDGINWWRRAGELRALGFIAFHPDGLKRKGVAKVARKVSVVTNEGAAAMARRGEEG